MSGGGQDVAALRAALGKRITGFDVSLYADRLPGIDLGTPGPPSGETTLVLWTIHLENGQELNLVGDHHIGESAVYLCGQSAAVPQDAVVRIAAEGCQP